MSQEQIKIDAQAKIDEAAEFIGDAGKSIAVLGAENNLQSEAKDDFLIALASIQSTELLALRRAYNK